MPFRGGSIDTPRWKQWLAGAAGGAAVLLGILLLGALFIIPIVRDQGGDVRSGTAGRNLKRIWAAEQAWALANDGAWAEFRMGPEAQDDPAWKALLVDIPPEEIHHEYRAQVKDGVLWLTAVGNVDRDASLDDWELASSDGEIRQVFDDVREIYLHILYYERLKRVYRDPHDAPLTLDQRSEALEIRTLLEDTAGHAQPG